MAIELGLMALGTGLKLFGGLEAGGAADEYYQERAMASRLNAHWKRLMGDYAAKLERERGTYVTGRQKAGYAHSGVVVDAGSPLLVQMETANQIEREAQHMILSSEMQARGLEGEAELHQKAGRLAKDTAAISALTDLVGFAGAGFEKNLFAVNSTVPNNRWFVNMTKDFGT